MLVNTALPIITIMRTVAVWIWTMSFVVRVSRVEAPNLLNSCIENSSTWEKILLRRLLPKPMALREARKLDPMAHRPPAPAMSSMYPPPARCRGCPP